jgi:hypothetical protein
VIYHVMYRCDHRDAFFRDDAESQCLRKESTMTLKWLAQSLAMGSASNPLPSTPGFLRAAPAPCASLSEIGTQAVPNEDFDQMYSEVIIQSR